MPIEPDQPSEEDSSDYDEPTEEEIAQMRAATPVEAAAVDALILAVCSQRWKKVAMVVGTTMDEFEERFPNLPFFYLRVRMQELEDQGLVDIQGDVFALRHSEIRIASPANAA